MGRTPLPCCSVVKLFSTVPGSRICARLFEVDGVCLWGAGCVLSHGMCARARPLSPGCVPPTLRLSPPKKTGSFSNIALPPNFEAPSEGRLQTRLEIGPRGPETSLQYDPSVLATLTLRNINLWVPRCRRPSAEQSITNSLVYCLFPSPLGAATPRPFPTFVAFEWSSGSPRWDYHEPNHL